MANYNIKASLYLGGAVDAYGSTSVGALWGNVWCEATYSGGSRRTQAGRLVGEHQVVLTTHWREGIEKCRFVKFEGMTRPIVDIVPEGRRKRVHIITYTNDQSYET